ncbi:MAG: 7-carboxy-7-deazaguanine synthase QueE [Gammaproteobacteria bacterium]|nr:MAG: 7-carboxy-7-deazaguanine synthase QueE [Gammaproteobacteria bacterium]
MDTLRITEIFHSLQGEGPCVGLPTVFIRLTGCPLRCGYCDTSYAFSGGESMQIDSILAITASYGTGLVTVTGGEPLAQMDCLVLLKRLCDAGFRVSLETSGARDISAVDKRVMCVMDLKTPASGEMSKNRYENIEHLKSGDQIKFVICDRQDYNWAKTIILEHELQGVCDILFSPVYETQPATELADWILQDRLPVRLQIQLHKFLWGEGPGH